MINRVLERDFVLEKAAAVRAELARLAAEEGAADERRAEYAYRELEKSLESEKSVGGEEPGKAWVPRDAPLSLLQTVMEQQILERHGELLVDGPGDWLVATQDVAEDDLDEAHDFTAGDPGWVTDMARALATRLWRGRHPFVEAESPPEAPLAVNARVILLSDWATGGRAAREVADLARAEIGSAGAAEVHVIHLGDVYFAGEEREVQERFLDCWPVALGEEGRYRSWAVMGNHDMYAGGHGFYECMLMDPRFAGQRTQDGQGISYFALSNRHWQILGIDTAWDDHLVPHLGHHGFLKDPQGRWIADRVRAAREANQRTMLLSHHQFYTTHADRDDQARAEGNLPEKLQPAFDAGGIDAWFWGHEHRCQTFAPRTEVRYSACIGHGAMPEAVGGGTPEAGEWEFDEGGAEWRWCGLAVLDFREEAVEVKYIAQNAGHFESDFLPVP